MKTPALALALFLGLHALVACSPTDTQEPSPRSDGSARLVLPNYGEVRVVAVEDLDSSPPRVDLLLKNAEGTTVQRLPDMPVNGTYAYYETREIGFGDVNQDGLQDVVVIAEFMTGIGPSGAEPFAVAGIYLQTATGFEHAVQLEELVNGERHAGQWQTVADVMSIAAASER